MKLTLVSIAILTGILSLASCQQKTDCAAPQTIMDPNPSSELTLLMREMYDHYEDIAEKLIAGEEVAIEKLFEDIHTAASTTPEKAKSDLYQAMAANYIIATKELAAAKDNKAVHFNLLIDNCMSCHQQMCPGPMVKIKKLYVGVDG